ncbi:MAG: conjugal transfer protein TraX [Mollicutes bacterium]|nr:conjugal transfer protein TraX [Mollicutes bacterium]
MVISNFILKIIALIFMTIDHVGVFLPSSPLQFTFRVLGKIALPIFIYTTLEGCKKTKDIKKYMLRLGVMAILMYIAIVIAQLVLYFNNGYLLVFQNIFFTLLNLVFVYYLFFVNKNKNKRRMVILPILIFIGSYIFFLLRINGISEFISSIFVDGLTTMYALEAPIMFVGALLGIYIYEEIVRKRLNNDETLVNEFLCSKKAQLSRNIIMCLSIALVSLIMYSFTYENIPSFTFGNACVYNTYFIICFPFILLYNGKRGFNNKIVNGAFYLYYPLHIGIIALIFILIGGF